MDFSKLSREQKEALLVALEEKKRRDIIARPLFKPHAGQLKVITSPALERYLFCGNAFGKSAVLVNEVDWAAKGFNPITKKHSPVPAKIVLILDTPEKIEDFITEYRKWNELDPDWLSKRGKPHNSHIAYPNGSTVTVLTHQVEPLKLEGSQWTHIFADEPPPQGVFNAIFRGARIKGRPARVLLAGTPITAAWLRTDVYEPWTQGKLPYVECFTGDSDENRDNLETGYLERFSAKLSEKEREIRLKGKFFDIEGLALAHLFSKKTHVLDSLEWDDENPCILVFDPHPEKQNVGVLIGCDRDNRLYVLEEYAEKAVARQFMTNVIELGWFEKYSIVDVIYDSLGSGDMTSGEGFRSFGEVINEVLAEHELGRARATTRSDKDDDDFIDRIRDVLVLPEEPDTHSQRVPRMRFLAHCRRCVDDVERVEWYLDKQIKENKKKLDTRKRDFLSCIKYALASNLFYDKPRRLKPHYVTAPVYGGRRLHRPANVKIGLRSMSRIRRRPTGSGPKDF